MQWQNLNLVDAQPDIIDRKQLCSELVKSIKQRSIVAAYRASMFKEEKKKGSNSI